MLVLSKELEGEGEGGLDCLMREHCRRQRELKVPVSAALLIGAQAGEDVWVLAAPLMPLPETVPTDESSPPTAPLAKSLKPATECLDWEWAVEVGKQTLRCLPGGLEIAGLLLLGEKRSLREMEPKMLPALAHIHRAAARGRLGAELESPQPPRMFLVSMEAPRGKPEARVLDLTTKALASARLSFQTPRWVPLRCRFRLPALRFGSNHGDLEAMVKEGLSPLVSRVLAALPLFNGEVKDPEEAVLASRKGKTKGREAEAPMDVVEADLLLGEEEADENEAKAEWRKLEWELELGGSMEVWALVEGRASWATAAAAVKGDILRSLRTRLRLHWEEMRVVEGEEEEAKTAPLLHELPRRVILASPPSPLPAYCPLSDYAFQGDDLADIADNLGSLFQLSLSPDQLRLTEEQLPALQADMEEEELGVAAAAPFAQAVEGSKNTTLLLVLSSIFVALLAFAVYILLRANDA